MPPSVPPCCATNGNENGKTVAFELSFSLRKEHKQVISVDACHRQRDTLIHS